MLPLRRPIGRSIRSISALPLITSTTTSPASTPAPPAKTTFKVYGDWKPATWVTLVQARPMASAAPAIMTISAMSAFSSGRCRGLAGVAATHVSGVTTTTFAGFPNAPNYAPAYRQFYLDDRNRTQAKFQVDVDVLRNFTVTPTVNYARRWLSPEQHPARSDKGRLDGRRARNGLCRLARRQVCCFPT